MKKVSVIMPAYNAEQFIDESIQSIIKQSYETWDLTIVNDGSLDNTKEIICNYVVQYPEKIRLIDKSQNEGTVSGLNMLIDAVDGDYICWLSADDLYTDNMLEDSVAFLGTYTDYDLVFSGYETIDAHSRFLREAPYNRGIEDLKCGDERQPYNYLLTTGCCIHGCTVMVRKYCYDGVGKFNKKYRYAHDYDIWMRMASKYKMGYIDSIHVRGREYSSQISMQGNNEIDAIHVLFDFVQSDNFTALYRKAGYINESEAITSTVIGQLKAYKHREKEFTELLKVLLDNPPLIISDFWKDADNQKLYDIIKWLRDGHWYCEEAFFADDTKESYLNVLCDIFDVDVFLINRQAVRFDRFDGNSMERFNKGLMRSNDVIVGVVESNRLQEFLNENAGEYRVNRLPENAGKLRVGFSHYMYRKLKIHEQLDATGVKLMERDIWWELLKGIYNRNQRR